MSDFVTPDGGHQIPLDERVLAEIANVIWRSPMMTTKHILAFDKLCQQAGYSPPKAERGN